MVKDKNIHKCEMNKCEMILYVLDLNVLGHQKMAEAKLFSILDGNRDIY